MFGVQWQQALPRRFGGMIKVYLLFIPRGWLFISRFSPMMPVAGFEHATNRVHLETLEHLKYFELQANPS